MVIVEQTLEVGHEHRTVLTYLNIEVSVMPAIFRSRIIADKGKALPHGI